MEDEETGRDEKLVRVYFKSKEMKDKIYELAKKCDLSPSSYIRMVLRRHLDKVEEDTKQKPAQ